MKSSVEMTIKPQEQLASLAIVLLFLVVMSLVLYVTRQYRYPD